MKTIIYLTALMVLASCTYTVKRTEFHLSPVCETVTYNVDAQGSKVETLTDQQAESTTDARLSVPVGGLK